MSDNKDEATRLLLASARGDRGALDELMPLVYQELRKIARGYLRDERVDHTLPSAALVNEAYVRLVDQRSVDWRNRAQFLGIAAQTMRRILVDYGRRKQARKRGGGDVRLEFTEDLAPADPRSDLEVVELDRALDKLAALDPRQSRVVELRYFGGLNVRETAEVLGVSPATVDREWGMGKAWLRREIRGG